MNEIKVKFEPAVQRGARPVLTYETIVQIFDKRQVVRGIRGLKLDFRQRRRAVLQQGNYDGYKKIVLDYKRKIESKLESNLLMIAKKVPTNIVINAIAKADYGAD